VEELAVMIQRVIEGLDPYALLLGDCRELLDVFPPESVDCVVTSPPYWQQRRYDVSDDFAGAVIGAEGSPQAYVKALSDSTIVAAIELGRRGIGIDISKAYLDVALERLAVIQPRLVI